MFRVLKLVISLLLLASCFGGTKNTSTIANNIKYNERYKNQEKISPILNIVARRQDENLLQKNYDYYNHLRATELAKFENNRHYMKFVEAHDVKKIKNVTVETIPLKNREYIKMQEEKNSIYELNRMPHNKIEYVMFINEALMEEKYKAIAGDPIEHPYVYTKEITNTRQIVMGDEYRSFSSWCEVNGQC